MGIDKIIAVVKNVKKVCKDYVVILDIGVNGKIKVYKNSQIKLNKFE